MTYPGERRVVFLFCIALIALTVVSEIHRRGLSFQKEAQIELSPLIPLPSISIEVRGAVKREGLYHLPKGSTIEEALELAGVKEEADLSKIDLKKPLLRKQTLKIPYQKRLNQTAMV